MAEELLPPQPGELTLAETAERLGCSAKHVRRLVADGALRLVMRRIACNVIRPFVAEADVHSVVERETA